MPPKAKSAERLQQEAEAQRARVAALQYLAKTGSGPSRKEIAQHEKQREKWTNPTTQAVQQRLAHLQPASQAAGNAPTRDNTLAVMAAHRARLMLQTGGGVVDSGDDSAFYPSAVAGASWPTTSVGASDTNIGLPDGWKRAIDPASGETYYWNEVRDPEDDGGVEGVSRCLWLERTKETSWDRPQTKKPDSETTTAKDDDEEELEIGWEEVEDPQSGQIYYWHRESNETTWTKPVKKTVSLEQAREAKSKLDAILKLCGPSKKPSAQGQKKQIEPSTSAPSPSTQRDSTDELASRKRDSGDDEDTSGPAKKARTSS